MKKERKFFDIEFLHNLQNLTYLHYCGFNYYYGVLYREVGCKEIVEKYVKFTKHIMDTSKRMTLRYSVMKYKELIALYEHINNIKSEDWKEYLVITDNNMYHNIEQYEVPLDDLYDYLTERILKECKKLEDKFRAIVHVNFNNTDKINHLSIGLRKLNNFFNTVKEIIKNYRDYHDLSRTCGFSTEIKLFCETYRNEIANEITKNFNNIFKEGEFDEIFRC